MLRASSGVIRSSALEVPFSDMASPTLLLWFLFGTLRGAGGEGTVACNRLSYYEGVDVVGALVGIDALDISHVLHDAVVEEDTVAAEHVAGEGRDAAGFRDVVHLEHRDRCGVEPAGVLEAADMDGEELAEGDLIDHLDELLLHELEAGYGLPELLPLLRVGERRLVAVGRLPEPVPPYAVARVREDGEGGAKAIGFRKAGALGYVAAFEGNVRLPGGALGGLAGEDVGVEAGIVGLDEEAGDPAFRGPGPDHCHVREGGVADPLLLPAQHVAADLLALRHGRQPALSLLL